MGKITSWTFDSLYRIKNEGKTGIVKSAKPIYKKSLHQTQRFSGGSSIYESDWDLLIILDACRIDLLESVVSEYDFLCDIRPFRSVESATRHWMVETFKPKWDQEMTNTTYICGNPHSETALQSNNFCDFYEIWRTAWDDKLGTLPARAVTDRAIEVGRSADVDRMIVHYMQPHCPFVAGDGFKRGKSVDDWKKPGEYTDIWKELESGCVTEPQVWGDYRSNLRYVLDDLEILLNNFDAENVVISSDHGNALGEWGLFGHPAHMPFRCLREVPWVETTAQDIGDHIPEDHTVDAKSSTQERLEALGYV